MRMTSIGRLLAVVLLACAAGAPAQKPADGAAPLRILHVMSYHSPWRWTDGQLEGFKAGLADPRAQVKVFALDTKRHSSPEQMAARARRRVEAGSRLHHRR